MQIFAEGKRSKGHSSSQLPGVPLADPFPQRTVEKLRLKDFQVSGNIRISAETVKGTE